MPKHQDSVGHLNDLASEVTVASFLNFVAPPANTSQMMSAFYYSTGLFGAYISSATYNNGAFTQVNGTRAVLGIPWSSTQTPSSYLLNQFNANSSLSNIASTMQAAAQLGQQLIGCTAATGAAQ